MPISIKWIIFIFIIFITGIFWVDFVSAQSYYCQPEGWAYSDTIGWISFDCENCPPGSEIGCGEDLSVCETEEWEHYGVKIDSSDEKNFLDYAWNGYLGWIDFGPTADFPGISHPHQAQLDGDNVNGWARIISLSSSPGGGWISMSCATDPSISDCTGWEDYGVYFDQCEFKNWAWSDDIGWISFNCQTDDYADCSSTIDGKLVSDFYRVRCGEELNSFELINVYLDGNSSCKVACLEWEKVDGADTYEIYQEGDPLSKGSFPTGNCGDTTCYACLDNLGSNPETTYTYYIKALSGGESACGVRLSNEKSITTTICPSQLTFCPPSQIGMCSSLESLSPEEFESLKKQICSEGGIKLQWSPAVGYDGSDGADEGYILYQAMGGEGYKEVKRFAQYGDEGGENPEDYYSPDLGVYSWILSKELETFGIGVHYYFFIRAMDGTDFDGVGQDVDSNRVEICCLTQ